MVIYKIHENCQLINLHLVIQKMFNLQETTSRLDTHSA